MNYNEQDNDWANDIQGKAIHITQAKSGAQGYYCLGCHKEMQAVKGLKKKHYYRHHVVDVDTSKTECVHASREYRERLAYFYFMRVKEIKVPAVYKYPPKGIEGNPNLIQEEQTFKASKVARELTFYENEEGKILWGKNPEIDERYLLIKPDAVFFDEEGKPILFIEFVVTHKPDQDKLAKLRRLGINTVQIIVPKKSEEEIEKEISKVSKVKWIYHEIESNTEYTSVSEGSTEGIPSIDDEQRKLFEESYACRATQIGNLIRTITRRLESESYKQVERLFEQEIQRIEDAASRVRDRLGEIQSGIEREIYSELDERREKFDEAEKEFQDYRSGLDNRYYSKRATLIEEQGNIEREIEFRSSFGKSFEGTRREFERRTSNIIQRRKDIEFEQKAIEREKERVIREIDELAAYDSDIRVEEGKLRIQFEQLEKEELAKFDTDRRNLELKIKDFREIQNAEESGIRSETERRYEQIVKRINDRDIQGGDELSNGIKTILELRGLFESYTFAKSTLERYRKGIQVIKNGTWKEWD
ncbi:MAG: hypothetical protein Q8K02_09355 [Flavobacterium sp.]|nr:hypothetical protein [Flavobacterium sp.]